MEEAVSAVVKIVLEAEKDAHAPDDCGRQEEVYLLFESRQERLRLFDSFGFSGFLLHDLGLKFLEFLDFEIHPDFGHNRHVFRPFESEPPDVSPLALFVCLREKEGRDKQKIVESNSCLLSSNI